MTLNDSWDISVPTTIGKSAARDSELGCLLARHRKLFVEHWAARDGSVPETRSCAYASGSVDEAEWRGDLRFGFVPARRSNYASFTRKETRFICTCTLAWRLCCCRRTADKVKSARFLAGGTAIPFQQDRFRVRLTGLPVEAPEPSSDHNCPRMQGEQRWTTFCA